MISVARNSPERREYMKLYLKKYYEKNKELLMQRAVDWVKNNPERAKSNFRKSYEKNKYSGKRKELSDNWIANNLEKHRAYHRAYIAARRAKIKCVEVLPIDYAAIHARRSGICGICDAIIEDKFEYDHIIPIVHGGAHSTDNLQLSHPRCNRIKNSKLNFKLSGVPK